MPDPNSVQQDFQRRLTNIPPLGMGLSVDVYSPDLFQLVNVLRTRGFHPGYLEIFKATTTALTAVRRALPDIPLAYHGDGLWITQPDFQASSFFQQDVSEIAAQLNGLQSLWLNHECAMKQMAGYSFGTYIPPLYTQPSAEVVAENISMVQEAIDQHSRRPDGTTPLFLLEMPPLTYFSAGTLSIPHFFQLITQWTPCGLVLDIGHLWTVYRYTDASRQMSLEQFVEEFLGEFPLERVVEIHIAGLSCHATGSEAKGQEALPEWIDAHAAPIPSILFTMLEQVLAHSHLVSLRAVALEVDTKPIEMIVEEYAKAVRRFSLLVSQTMARGTTSTQSSMEPTPGPALVQAPVRQCDRQQLTDTYAHYARMISGQTSLAGLEWQEMIAETAGVTRYRTSYVPYEILHWGGDLADMFPETCHVLADRGICLIEFVDFWFRSPRPLTRSYDFFLLKVERFYEFVTERVPEARICVQRECDILCLAYAQANEVGETMMEMERTQ